MPKGLVRYGKFELQRLLLRVLTHRLPMVAAAIVVVLGAGG
ncbi:MAG: hypothetical protein ACRELD_03885 [Longimicrobiales bacterium]